ncbi:MAG: hypothetical protein H0V29_04810 [Thermoleophilaceae bacterium]|nr:hypothetical protein [Thermoleophilaceae bacterium]
MKTRLAGSTLLTFLLLAAPALAQVTTDNGEGYLGETDDKIVTFVFLGVLVFFFLFTAFGSLIQWKLEKRKDEKKAATLRQRAGW